MHLRFPKGITFPLSKGPVRFAVLAQNGLTSNSWRLWVSKSRDVYVACRDNFKEAKVSLHTSGRWRVGFTQHAIKQYPEMLSPDQNRAWIIWDKPPATLPQTVIAFRLLFPISELVVRPEQRKFKCWNRVIYIEADSTQEMIAFTIFVTEGQPALSHASEPSVCLASLEIDNGQFVQLVAHGEPLGNILEIIDQNVRLMRHQYENAGGVVSPEFYAYLCGQGEDKVPFIVGGRVSR